MRPYGHFGLPGIATNLLAERPRSLATLTGRRTGALAKNRRVARRFAELTRRIAAVRAAGT